MRFRKLMTVAAGALLCSAALIPTAASAAENGGPGAATTHTLAGPRSGWERSCGSHSPDVCVYVRYNGHGWDAFGTFPTGVDEGHIDIFGPDHVTHHSGPDRHWNPGEPSKTFSGTGSGNVCAQGWRLNADDSYSSVGLRCIDM